MITFKQKVYATYVTTDERSGKIIAYFTNEKDAKLAGVGKGWWGSNGSVISKIVEINVYESLEEYDANTREQQRRIALKKLTPLERELLGLSIDDE
jgi:hypothetical protein